MATNVARAPFRVGSQERYLPNITITFLRSKSLPATQARFHVPLWFSKLDLRDYLYHAYSVRIHSCRSYVKQSRVVQGAPNATPRPQPSRWHRPRSQKFMTVELERPFVWPEEPEDYSEWNMKEVQQSEEEQEKFSKSLAPGADAEEPKERRERMREQAKRLLEGKEKWRPAVASRFGAPGVIGRSPAEFGE